MDAFASRPSDGRSEPGAGTSLLRVITRLNVGGPARHAIILSRRLAEAGYATQLLHGTVGAAEGEIEPAGVDARLIPEMRREVRPLQDGLAVRHIHRIVRQRKPAIVHTHTAKAGALGRLAARRSRVPIIVHTFHGHSLEGYFSPVVRRTFLSVERGLARWTDALIAVSERVRDELLQMGIGRPEQWRVVPLGLDLTEILHSRIDQADARNQLGLAHSGPVVGIVGRLVPIKDLETFLRAAARVSERLPDTTFVVAGDGELRAQVEGQAHQLLGDRVRFLGWVHDLPTLYAALDVTVLTSRNEGTPVSLIEAAAAGKAAVATRVGGVPDVVRDGKTGLLVPPGDPTAVAESMIELLRSPERAARLGEEARLWVQDRFSSDRLVETMARLYAELLVQKGLRPPATHRLD